MKQRAAGIFLCLALLCTLPAFASGAGVAGRSSTFSAAGTAAVDEDASLWVWGENGWGAGSNLPERLLEDVAVIDRQAAIKTDGSLWMWGYRGSGRLGDGSTSGASAPVKVMENVAAVSSSGAVVAAVKTDGSLWMWGDNGMGQLGNGGKGDATYTPYRRALPLQTTPVRIMEDVAAVSVGGTFTMALKEDGTLWTWGSNQCGQLGSDGGDDSYVISDQLHWPIQTVPQQVLEGVAAIAAGNNHAAAIKTDGSLWLWGANGFGQLGNGSTQETARPVKLMEDVSSVSLGADFSAAVKSDGSLWMWGSNTYGELGNGGVGNQGVFCFDLAQTTPVKVMDGVLEVSAGDLSAAALKEDGSFWMWGCNDAGELGNGGGGNGKHIRFGTVFQTLPIRVQGLNVKRPGAFTPASGGAGQASGLACASDACVRVDGVPVVFHAYALRDAGGGETNYVRVRDVAAALNGTSAQFHVDWDGAVSLTAGAAYAPDGSEGRTPFAGDRPYEMAGAATLVDGAPADLEAILLKDDAGRGYTYYKLRDLGEALGFDVDWSAEQGISIETDKPYTED